jgi:hypothetical protein
VSFGFERIKIDRAINIYFESTTDVKIFAEADYLIIIAL